VERGDCYGLSYRLVNGFPLEVWADRVLIAFIRSFHRLLGIREEMYHTHVIHIILPFLSD